MLKTKQSQVISLRVPPEIKELWDKLNPAEKERVKTKFIIDLMGLKSGDLELEFKEGMKYEVKIRVEYDERGLEKLREVLSVSDDVVKWVKRAKSFLASLIEAPFTGLCEYGGLARVKRDAKELLEEAPF